MKAQHPAQLIELILAAYRSQDLAAFKALYEPIAVIAAPGQRVMKAMDVFDNHAYLLKHAATHEMTVEVKRIIEAGDIALLTSHLVVKGPELNLDTTAIEVVRRQPDGCWLYVIDNSFGA